MFAIKPYLSYIVQNIKPQLRPLGSELYNVRPEHYVLSNEAFCLSLMMMNVKLWMYHILTNWSPERLGRTKKGVTKTSKKT